jgi:pectate lyase
LERCAAPRTSWASRVLAAVVAAVALTAFTAPSALAAPAGPAVSVASVKADRVSVLVAGFARGSTIEFQATAASCVARSSVVAAAAAFYVEFVTAPPCAGPTVVTATSGGRSVSTSFAFPTPPGSAPAPAPPAPPAAAPSSTPSTAPSPDAASGPRPVASRCTLQSTGGDVPAAKPGDTVCFSGTLPRRLEIRASGTDSAPITYSGMGTAVVPGITAHGSNIVLEGFVSTRAADNGFYVSGNNITVRDNDISAVSITNDDVDAIRFFGDGITIAHNSAHDIWANPQAGGSPHTDCMQTYAHSEPASSNVVIEGNHCASPQFHQCLMAEGPHDFEDGASGVGSSANWVVRDNYFECHADAQTIALQDIHNVTFANNDFAGSGGKAIALQKDATGATVSPDNVKGSGYRSLVEIDDQSARQGYTGP